MEAIGIVNEIDIKGLTEYIVNRKEHIESLKNEKESMFEIMYSERLFPEKVKVRYEYSSGMHDVSYGENKHKWRCKDIFYDFFDLWRIDRDYDNNPERQNRANLELLEKLVKHLDYASTYNQSVYYVYESSFGYYVTAVNEKFFIPKQFVKVTPFVDYSDTPLRLIGGNEEMAKNLPSVGEETQKSLKSKLEDKKAEIENKMQEIKAKEEEQKAEIEAMKRAIEEKYKSTFDLMASKKQELENMMKQLEGQLFVLDTQIYGIRCFFGETVKFTKISSGNNAPLETPVVMYQKIRFLDEELAKYAAIYNVDGDDTKLFEELLKNRQDMRDFFFPAGKTLSLVRISRDGVHYKSSSAANCDGRVINIYNVMNEYQVYHGKQIAVLVRNGDNCYIGWTEEERIKISDGNAFLTPKTTIEDDKDVKKDWNGDVVEEQTDKKEVAARFFIFSIAQGLIENSKLLELPNGVSITQNSPYVVFSMADNWLSEDTYGSYDDIMDKCSINARKGDKILTLRYLKPEGNVYRSYNNDRGRGYANRTHDVSVSDNTLYNINLVEDDERDNLFTYEYRHKGKEDWICGKWITELTENDDWMQDFTKRHDFDNWEFRNIKFCGPEKHVFVSLSKDCYWTNSDARANFELYEDEYINLTFLNTIYIRYIITNRKMPNRYFSGSVNFSYLLPYMNTAIEYLKEREEKEYSLISNYVALKENWQMALSDWKIEHNVHDITEYQAKRFAKWYSTMEI